MPPKKNLMMPPTVKSSIHGESDDTFCTPRYVSLSLLMQGDPPGPGEWIFLSIYNAQVVLDGKWHKGQTLETEALPLNLQEPYFHAVITDVPLIFILRLTGGKGAKDPDPLLNLDNRAGGTVDLFPLLLGEEEIFIRVPLVSITTGQATDCVVQVRAVASGCTDNTKVPLLLTMISGHCLPYVKEGTVYLAAIGLDGVHEPIAVNFGLSLSTASAEKIVWATASHAGQAANSALNVPNYDRFVPQDFEPEETDQCRSFYWNAMKRVLVDPILLRSRLSAPFIIEVAGVPRMGKIDVRGRYMGFVDAGVLLEPGRFGVTLCTKLLFYSEADLPEQVGALLELPPSSAKASARDTNLTLDEYGHSAYIVMRFDLTDPVVPKSKIASLFHIIGFSSPEGPAAPVDELAVELQPEDPNIDVRRIRKEGGALAVHKELSGLSMACRGAVPMNQGIKRTAANRLLMRVRTMLKQFSPGDCSYVDWQDIVSGQHAASRRAVNSSFAPQPPPLRQPARAAAARSRMAGDTRIADRHIKSNLKVAPDHPRSLLSMALHCLEEGNDIEAKNYLLEGLSVQTKNRYLLWTFGGQEFDKGVESFEMASAAFRIAVKGDYSEGTTNAIGWAALHALYHFNNNPYAGFVAASKMRKAYELNREWKKFLKRWTDTSGAEEAFWIPSVIATTNPLLIAAAFFLCLRCYTFCEILLQCVEQGCATRGSRRNLKYKVSPDVYYIRAASLVLRRQLDKAMEVTQQGIKKFGPSAIMSQMRATCLICTRGWDGECESAFKESERYGTEPCPGLLLRAAMGGYKFDPNTSLQRAALAHKIAPCGHSALVIGRIYAKLGEEGLAERWAAAAVKSEPLLADGWAFLSLLAMYERNLDKARTMLRTAKQVGPISSDIKGEVEKVMDVVKLETLPESLAKNLCFCHYYRDC